VLQNCNYNMRVALMQHICKGCFNYQSHDQYYFNQLQQPPALES
jgi:hypothetical protein